MWKQLFCVGVFIVAISSQEDTQPLLVHVLFRHGHRTPESDSFYVNDPYRSYDFFPVGYGALINKGKSREYSLGKFLRERYGNFLGEYYTPNLVDARSTDYDRTKMSVELVLAGLFPPSKEQIWKEDFSWQPIPYNYVPLPDDYLLGATQHQDFKDCYNQFKQLPENQDWFRQYQELYDILNEYTGNNNITDFDGVANIYDVLMSESEFGLELPEWTKSVFPDRLEPVAAFTYYLKAGNLELRRMHVGELLEKIVEDTTDKINGNLDPKDRKLFLYSAHDTSVGAFLTTLDVFDFKVPTYGECVLVEVHEIDEVYGLKFFLYNWAQSEPQLLKLPECEEFCPLDQFVTIVEKYFPPVKNIHQHLPSNRKPTICNQ